MVFRRTAPSRILLAMTTVRLPRVLKRFACRRSLLCCQHPWRVWLADGEVESITGLVGAVELPEADRPRFDGWYQTLGHGLHLVAQVGTRCIMLDPREPACVLQRAAGLDALPLQCRNFPRSVTASPAGLEVAFLLDCPSVARVAVEAPEPFSWHEIAASDWPFPPTRRISFDSLVWRGEERASQADLEALRRAWWSALEGAVAGTRPAEGLVGLLAGLVETPEEPEAGASTDAVPIVTPAPSQRRQVMHFLERLGDRGAIYQAGRAVIVDALVAEASAALLVRAADIAPEACACAAGLLVQLAGVHVDQPVLEAIVAAGWQMALTLRLAAALAQVPGILPRIALRDALAAAAHLASFQHFSALVMMG